MRWPPCRSVPSLPARVRRRHHFAASKSDATWTRKCADLQFVERFTCGLVRRDHGRTRQVDDTYVALDCLPDTFSIPMNVGTPAVLAHSWLLLIHQLPAKPAYLRVKIWRRLQALGAIAVKNAVHVLPMNEETQEDFEWLLQEIVEGGGEAFLCEARLI